MNMHESKSSELNAHSMNTYDSPMTSHVSLNNGLRVSDVSKTFTDVQALRGVSCDVAAGSFTALLGPSGCGKTTLLRIIAGFEVPSSGEVRIGEQLMAGPEVWVEPETRHVGIVPQEGALFPHLSVQDNVGFGLPRGQRRGRIVDDLLELVGLAGMQRRRPHELSGGQQQRVALARCLAAKPRVVLLDEPFAALDATLRLELREETRKLLRSSGTTTILVTHDQDEALAMADHVALMRNGHVVQFATPGELYNTPADTWAASFIGEANLISVDSVALHAHEVLSPFGVIEVRADHRGVAGPAVAMLRPEQLHLVTPGQPEANANGAVMQGVIEHVVFHGHDHLVSINVGKGTSHVILVRAPAYENPIVGQTVTVAVSGKALLLSPP
jgi:iron(III) transport system ATP-binding protein